MARYAWSSCIHGSEAAGRTIGLVARAAAAKALVLGPASVVLMAGALVLAAASPGAFRGTAQAALVWDTSALTQSPEADFMPAVDRGRVAWVGALEGGYGLYTWDSLTETTRLLSTDVQWFEGEVVVARDLVLWTGGQGALSFPRYWDAATGVTGTIPAPAGNQVFSDGRYVVWQARTPATGFDSEVYQFDVATGITTQLSDNNEEDDALGVDNGLVLVGRWVGGTEEVVLYDPGTKSSSVLTTKASTRPAVIGDGWVAWLQPANDPPSIMGDDLRVYAYDLADGTTIQVTSQPGDRGGLALRGGLLAWVEGTHAQREIYAVALPTGGPMQVSFDEVETGLPETDGRLVVWSNGNSGDTDSRDTWIAAFGDDANYHLGDLPNGLPRVSGGRAVWGTGSVDLGGLFVTQDVMTAVSPLFADVPLDHHYFAAIQGMSERRLIAGYPRADRWADFHPADPVLRAQFAKMIVGALGIPVDEQMTSGFTDLGPDRATDLYPHEYVAAVADAGITKGKTLTTFDPYAQITRAQVASMVYRALIGLPSGAFATPPAGYPGTLGNFSNDHALGMRVLEYNGLLAGIDGFGQGWSPWAPATRAEVASILWELMKAQARLVD